MASKSQEFRLYSEAKDFLNSRLGVGVEWMSPSHIYDITQHGIRDFQEVSRRDLCLAAMANRSRGISPPLSLQPCPWRPQQSPCPAHVFCCALILSSCCCLQHYHVIAARGGPALVRSFCRLTAAALPELLASFPSFQAALVHLKQWLGASTVGFLMLAVILDARAGGWETWKENRAACS